MEGLAVEAVSEGGIRQRPQSRVVDLIRDPRQISRAIERSPRASQDSRDEILKAAMHLFASRGFHETSMSEVARERRSARR